MMRVALSTGGTSRFHHLCWMMSSVKISAYKIKVRRKERVCMMDMRSQCRRALLDSVVVNFRDWVALCWPELLVSPEKKKHWGNGITGVAIAGDKCSIGKRDIV
ncbi:hypothetical protein L1887_12331 [Cichorium endivia]|nr:hypothetical protein L1887_12331 [Cichorium endivia]